LAAPEAACEDDAMHRSVVVSVVVTSLLLGACGRTGGDRSAETTTTKGAAPTPVAGDFGDLKGVCGPGDGKGVGRGVTKGVIRVGTIADPGYVGAHGLDQELFDAAEVFTKWCNDAGGINGLKIKDDELDAAIFNYQAKIREACGQDFFLVGDGGVFDNTGAADRLKCLLPQIPAYVVSVEAKDADLSVQPVPVHNYLYPIGEFRWIGARYPDAIKKVATLAGDFPVTILTRNIDKEVAQQLGWNVVADITYNVTGEPTWVPIAQKLKSAGARGALWVGEPGALAKLERALKDINYKLDFIRGDANAYDPGLIKSGSDALLPTYARSVFVPFERADTNPATKQYLDLFAKYKPRGKAHALLGLQAWSAWLLFAQSVKACGAQVTRRCVYDAAAQVKDWTGGGLHAPQTPATGSICYTALEATPTGFVVADVQPNQGPYNCDPQNLATLHGNYGKGVTLADVGKSLADLR
jgi:hypothetical protein